MKPFEVFPLFNVNIIKGQGCYVWDDANNRYLDLYGGHAVISVGHSHPYYIAKISEQLAKLGFYSNAVINRLQAEFAEKLGRLCGYPDYNLFMVNSGAEANENALKLASFHTGRRRTLAFGKAFHGRTSAAVAVTDSPAYRAPLNVSDAVTFVPLNDIEAVTRELSGGDYSSVIIEGIQGVAGIYVSDDEFLRQLRQLCTDTGTVLILDEIQSGYGRSGKFFAHQYAGIRPDLITVAKGIANGFPMSAMLISPEFQAIYGQLGTTFGGNHLACAAAIAVLEIMENERLVENAAEVGAHLLAELKKLPHIKGVRGRGLMLGIEFAESAKELRRKLLFEKHVFTGAAGPNVIRLLPPLSLTIQQADDFLYIFSGLLQDFR
ncbi:MAG: aminotransferase class III-fold pyridoxal phosphate-dependent enzyme [Bacteroidales bacterium]|jgi:acetylornithine aminotransferase|nr:aminotransferase class III-fold pyridoxal phosphate-dependent enzyme [Bacteroidales bacterium]